MPLNTVNDIYDYILLYLVQRFAMMKHTFYVKIHSIAMFKYYK